MGTDAVIMAAVPERTLSCPLDKKPAHGYHEKAHDICLDNVFSCRDWHGFACRKKKAYAGAAHERSEAAGKKRAEYFNGVFVAQIQGAPGNIDEKKIEDNFKG